MTVLLMFFILLTTDTSEHAWQWMVGAGIVYWFLFMIAKEGGAIFAELLGAFILFYVYIGVPMLGWAK